jgi:hypothetical protein
MLNNAIILLRLGASLHVRPDEADCSPAYQVSTLYQAYRHNQQVDHKWCIPHVIACFRTDLLALSTRTHTGHGNMTPMSARGLRLSMSSRRSTICGSMGDKIDSCEIIWKLTSTVDWDCYTHSKDTKDVDSANSTGSTTLQQPLAALFYSVQNVTNKF